MFSIRDRPRRGPCRLSPVFSIRDRPRRGPCRLSPVFLIRDRPRRGPCRLSPAQKLFCGDQFTVELARNSQKNRINTGTKKDAFLGLEPTISNWHAEANYLQVACGFEVNDLMYYSVPQLHT